MPDLEAYIEGCRIREAAQQFGPRLIWYVLHNSNTAKENRIKGIDELTEIWPLYTDKKQSESDKLERRQAEADALRARFAAIKNAINEHDGRNRDQNNTGSAGSAGDDSSS